MRFWKFLLIVTFSYPVLSQKNIFDSVSIVSKMTYSKKLPFIDYATNELEYYTIDAIKPFFEKLKKSANQQVRVLHIGDSHVQYDQGAGAIRNSFQEQFGFSGRGFVFPYAAAGTHAAYDYKTSSTGKWLGSRNVSKEINFPLGVSGATIYTTDSTAGFTIQFYNSSKELAVVDKLNLFAQTGDSSFHLKYRLSPTSEWIPISLSHSPYSTNYVEVFLPKQMDKFLEFKVNKTDFIQKEFKLNGIQLVNSKNQGVLYNSVGINGANLVSFLKQELFVEQLRYVNPDLVILDYGTNDLAGGKFDSIYFVKNLTESIHRVKTVLPNVCIIIPSVQDFTVNGKNISITSDYSRFVRDFARNNNVVFYDYFWISGAKKSMKKWLNAGIAKSDQIHLTQTGYVLKGELYGNALLNSFARYLENPKDSVLYNRKYLESISKDSGVVSDSSRVEAKENKKDSSISPEIKRKEKEKIIVPTKSNTKIESNKVVYHVVKKGETLSLIARKYNTTVQKIKTKNKLKSDNLQIGQKLIIP
jgi:LysM repeat protein